MAENYRAIYDAALRALDASHAIACLHQDFSLTAHEMQRPSVLFRAAVSIDGNKWCALYGDNLQDGVAGFGDSPDEACRAFDKAWGERLAEHPAANNAEP